MKREVETVTLVDKIPEETETTVQSDYPYYYSSDKKTRLRIVDAILEFYLIEDLLLNFPQDFFLMERKRMSNYFLSLLLFRKDLTDKLARALFDYLCVSSFGEARHSKSKSGGAFLKSASLPEGSTDRYNIYNNAHKYSPAKFLPKLYKVFSYGNWTSGFGGIKWAKIVQSAMLYEKVPPQVFIDHVIDLVHNGGTAFDKDCVVVLTDRTALMYILNSKFSESGLRNTISNQTFTQPQNGHNVYITPHLKEIAIEVGARNFGQNFVEGAIKLKTKELDFPVPIQWEDRDIEIHLNQEIIAEYKKFIEERRKRKKESDLGLFNAPTNHRKEIVQRLLAVKNICQVLTSFQTGEYCKSAETKVLEYKSMKKEERRMKKLAKKELAPQTIINTILDDYPEPSSEFKPIEIVAHILDKEQTTATNYNLFDSGEENVRLP